MAQRNDRQLAFGRAYRIRLTELFDMSYLIEPPPSVRPGARIGVAALSGPVDEQQLALGEAELLRLGFEPVRARNLLKRDGLFAGSKTERLDGFHELAEDPSIEAIVFARGGSGLLGVLPGIDWSLLARHPRPYMGYSDLTAFLNLVPQKLGIAALHGPMVAVDLARGLLPEEEQSFLDALEGRWPRQLPIEVMGVPEEGGPVLAEGRLVGGCLSLLTAVLGTPFAVDMSDSVLFLEEVDEPPYRMDRMLTQLRLSGSLDGLGGWIVGSLEAALLGSEKDDRENLSAVLAETARTLAIPWAIQLPSGHTAPNLTLPLGLRARLRSSLSVLEVGLPPE